jgi:hypothetical protein
MIHEVLDRLHASLVAVSRDPGQLPHLAAAFRHLRTLLLSHLDYEEQAIGTALGVHRVGV